MSSMGEAETATADEVMESDADAMSEPEINISSDEEDEVTVSKSKGRPLSVVWNHFDRVTRKRQTKPDSDKYKYCRKIYKWLSGNGTSTLKKHMLSCSKNPDIQKLKKQTSLASYAQVKGEPRSGIGLWKFDQKACRDALAKMIIMDELPFRFVEREGFRSFCRVLQPLFKTFSRQTVARDIVDLYASAKTKIRNLFKKSNQRICLSTDSWTSLQNLSYMCLTAHFIDKDWKLHKRILNFCVISSHKGEAIGKALEACLIEWGVGRVCTVTVDNATANDAAVLYLKKKLSKKSGALILGGEFLHMRYCAHIINLIVRDGLGEIKQSISRIRDVVKYVRSSPQREERFKTCVVSEGITNKTFACLDVPTRWNSTYLMLSTALIFQKAFERLEGEDPHFLIGLHMGPPTTQDWDNARNFFDFLEKFYETTLHLMMFIAIVLDPHFKLRYVKFCFSELFDSDVVEKLTKMIRRELDRAFVEYEKFNLSAPVSSQKWSGMEIDQPYSEGSDKGVSFESKFQKYLEEKDDGGKLEIDRYLEERCEKKATKFNILEWWKVNSFKYPILSEIARDALAIPLSTVASKATFSTGGRIVDQFHSSLSPKLVECLICMQDWLRATPLAFEVEENIEEMQELELGNI
ncbi:hypothetical protein RHSIM_Rhsim10G0136400 [Rhododendron simsii]|uniref:Transposase n=1 Tax=Rhododendron simsii TaxID=118357 RepID=A0A834GCY3_RHOSS|nr:hypothetical protein RHSIM_Rhsim10G0136400 [Rhododendron simsii]